MGHFSTMGFDNYAVFGDVAVIAICLVVLILLKTSYVSRSHSLRIFLNIIGSLAAAAIVNIICHSLLAQYGPGQYTAIYITRLLYNVLLFDVFFLFTLYITVITAMEHRKARIVAVFSMSLMVVIVIVDVVCTLTGVGFKIGSDGAVTHPANLFMVGYLLYVILLAVLMGMAKNLLYKRVMYGFYAVMAVSVVLLFGQLALNQSSLTTMTFIFPVIAMLYVMHSTPYNVTLGSVDVHAMEDMVHNMYGKKESFVVMSLLIPEYDQEGKEIPMEMRSQVRKFSGDYFKNAVLFQISNGHLILIVPQNSNPQFEQGIENMMQNFYKQFAVFQRPYKIVIGESIDEISRKNEYASLIRSIQRGMEENEVHRITPEDIERFNRDEYILHELTDIYRKRDMEDPRVLAYCQPVFNLQTGQFDTAEALMRLDLEKLGLVTPNQFIPMAENQGYIHVLTEIILHKTCREIRRLTEEGFRISRVSVNVSVLELKDDGFCDDISQIIDGNEIDGGKIAIELTESRSEADFMIMKEKIEDLRARGIQFYLDDFGTGYSNMERIIELPFDIIKFDRSLVIASGAGQRSEKIVENLAHMFRDMDYSVLYEGVEDDSDEARCREMSASYLQGYKYSRPVPIGKLREFLPHAG